jgi:glycosyltransferase involved in cell wall biosynthesis
MILPKISVVVPSFNQASYLEATLKSILEQNYPNLELIVIDGGSKDGSIELIKRYAPRLSYWVSEPDGGQTFGLIKGFSRSTGDIQCWINSDDLMAGTCLFEVANFFVSNPHAEAIYGDSTWIDRDGCVLRRQREIGFYRNLWLYTYNYIPGMSMYWKRSLYERVGGLDPAFNLAMDGDLWIRFSEVAHIHHVARNWSFMRFYPEQKNRSLRTRSNIEDALIRSRYRKQEAPWLYSLKRATAISVRVILKFFNGCYGLGYRRYIKDVES